LIGTWKPLGFGLAAITLGLISPLLGRLIDRFGPRRIILLLHDGLRLRDCLPNGRLHLQLKKQSGVKREPQTPNTD